MQLMTEDIKARLLANWQAEGEDHKPVAKFFDPCGAATWLITEMSAEDNDILFGLCDLGIGFPELGYVRLSELESVKGRLGLGIERDLHFEGRFPISVYAEAARQAGGITEANRILAQAAAALETEKRRRRP